MVKRDLAEGALHRVPSGSTSPFFWAGHSSSASKHRGGRGHRRNIRHLAARKFTLFLSPVSGFGSNSRFNLGPQPVQSYQLALGSIPSRTVSYGHEL